jgi:hypothetical protein
MKFIAILHTPMKLFVVGRTTVMIARVNWLFFAERNFGMKRTPPGCK